MKVERVPVQAPDDCPLWNADTGIGMCDAPPWMQAEANIRCRIGKGDDWPEKCPLRNRLFVVYRGDPLVTIRWWEEHKEEVGTQSTTWVTLLTNVGATYDGSNKLTWSFAASEGTHVRVLVAGLVVDEHEVPVKAIQKRGYDKFERTRDVPILGEHATVVQFRRGRNHKYGFIENVKVVVERTLVEEIHCEQWHGVREEP